ncbi:MAG: hypothetical protein WAM06_02530 [Methyloceanibacter sp.]
MTPANRHILLGTLVSVSLVALLTIESRPVAHAAEGDEVEYTFDRPITDGEQTYAWYRKTHGDEAAKRYGVDPEAVGDGMDTWHWWVGVDNPGFWRDLSVLTSGKGSNPVDARVDFLSVVMQPRADRWKKMGLINDPDTVAAEKPDKYGLMIDHMKDGSLTWDPEVFGYSSGVIGLQLFLNKKFDASKWSAKKYKEDPGSVEPPYLVGMSCGFCHVTFNPDKPPQDPVNPKWENIDSTTGNIYFREGMLFGHDLPTNSFAYQYLYNQEPGTSETSRFPSDFVNNPILINSIYRLGERLKLTVPEKITPAQRDLIKSMYAHVGLKDDDPGGALGGTEAEPTLKVPHILADGADSMSILMASTRVYVNEGMAHDLWVSTTWALNPFDLKESIRRDFKPGEFDLIGTARKDPNSPWMQTEKRMPNMALFLTTWDSFPLKDAIEIDRAGTPRKDGKDYLTTDADTLKQGKIVFADNCASCHSGKRPNPLPTDLQEQKQAWRDLVLRDDFLVDNYLSDDQRHPLSKLGTNAQRAMGTNAMGGHTWGQMSSQTYKDERVPTEPLQDQDANGKPIPLYDPLTGKNDIKFEAPASFYRTPTLVSVWATAPYLHNNALGIYTGDPSVAGRMAAYQDGMTKLLWPEKRLGIKSMKVTTEDSALPPMVTQQLQQFVPGLDVSLLRVPKGTPINLIMNVHPKNLPAVVQAYVDGVLQGAPKEKFAELQPQNHAAALQRVQEKMLEVSLCPDFIEDRGHTFGRDLSDQDKRALIEYMKYF